MSALSWLILLWAVLYLWAHPQILIKGIASLLVLLPQLLGQLLYQSAVYMQAPPWPQDQVPSLVPECPSDRLNRVTVPTDPTPYLWVPTIGLALYMFRARN